MDAVIEEKRQQAHKDAPPPPEEPKQAAAAISAASDETAQAASALEEEAGQQGAFNPETGEINWDCPCLGGMAHGPCGEEFKAAFSCFVYSNEEPKGMDCIEKFQYVYSCSSLRVFIAALTRHRHMQDCFRQHPEVYAAELAEDEEDEAPSGVEAASPRADTDSAKETAELPKQESRPPSLVPQDALSPSSAPTSHFDETNQKLREEEAVVDPRKRAFDATDANKPE